MDKRHISATTANGGKDSERNTVAAQRRFAQPLAQFRVRSESRDQPVFHMALLFSAKCED